MTHTIIVGLDFGTTFSGAAWAITKHPDNIHYITDWESNYNKCSDHGKCPTQLEYGDIGPQTPWGYNIPADKDVVRWFKLLLLDESDVPEQVAQSSQFQQAMSQQKRLKRSPVELVACFLRSLWRHCMDNIIRALGSDEVNSCKISIILTVPAMWPHYVQSKMGTAAGLAGMLRDRTTSAVTKTPTLHFVSEPEAAALAVLAEMHPRPDIQKNDTIIVCDAGGGTADLISYQVDDIDSFQLRECVAGEGGLCGGIFVDYNFEALIASKLNNPGWASLQCADKRKFMLEEWESSIKSQFSGDSRCFYTNVTDGYLPDSAMGKRRWYKLLLLKNGLLMVFLPVVDRICGLVERQEATIKENGLPPPKFIILVGGFGRCGYLRSRLKEVYPQSTILNPPGTQAWTAVCRGAVRHAMVHNIGGPRNMISKAGKLGSFTVQSRISRMSYGFIYHVEWDPNVHKEEDKYWCELREEWRAEKQMVWFLNQGQSLDNLSLSTHEYFRTFAAGTDPTIEESLFFCTSAKPPSRLTDEVKTLCVIKWNKKLDLSKLPRDLNSAWEPYHTVRYKIQVAVNGPELKITILHGRKKVAQGDVQVEFQ